MVSIVISDIPLLYLAIWRVIHNRGISKISSALLIVIAMSVAIAVGDLFAAGEVVFIMAIGAILEDMTTNRVKKGLKKLISLAPTQGRKIENGQEKIIPADKIQYDDILRILPGEIIPLDGIITLSVLGLLTPAAGALVHNAGSCFVVLIAALLYDRRFDRNEVHFKMEENYK